MKNARRLRYSVVTAVVLTAVFMLSCIEGNTTAYDPYDSRLIGWWDNGSGTHAWRFWRVGRDNYQAQYGRVNSNGAFISSSIEHYYWETDFGTLHFYNYHNNRYSHSVEY